MRRHPFSFSTRASTGTNCPWICTSWAPSISCRPRVPAAWNPTSSTVFRGSGSALARWCRTRPPVAMPLDDTTIAGPGRSTTAWDSCARRDRCETRCAECGQFAAAGAARDVRIQLGRVALVELQRPDRHRTVEVDRQRAHRLGVLEPLDGVEHLFHAADGERRNDHLAAALRGVVDDRGQGVVLALDRVQPVAVGGFDQQDVGRRSRAMDSAGPGGRSGPGRHRKITVPPGRSVRRMRT